MAAKKMTVRWDEVKAGDLIAHPWPSHRSLNDSLLEITSINLHGAFVDFMTPAGGDSRPGSSMIEVTREVSENK